MKTFQSYHSIISIFIAVLLFSSCDDFVEVDLPPTQLTSTTVFEDRATADAAIAEIYYGLRANGMLAGTSSGLSVEMGAYSDELAYYGDDSMETSNFYTNGLLATSGEILAWWNTAYNQIYQCNAVLQGVAASDGLEQSDKDKLRGEALFIRGLLHLYLVNIFGDIPYITTTDYNLNSTVSRMSTANVYEHIIADLTQASVLLPGDYTSPDRAKPNKFSAHALLARAYLSAGFWTEAANEASVVLNQSGTYTMGSVPGTFLKDSPSTIWQLATPADGQNTDEAVSFIFTDAPPYFVALSEELVTAFEPGDQRKEHWVGSVSDGTNNYYFAYKYKQVDNTGSSLEYPIMLRLSEQYLIRAEARAKQGDLTGAKEDLDSIRLFAGLGNTTAGTQEAIIAAIVRERRVEFFTEHGHRFFDLKRNNSLDASLSPTKPGWNASDGLLPIPDTEITLNPQLAPQNPGY
jgi:starch-binding outer membrane protein, SusD/RagB family